MQPPGLKVHSGNEGAKNILQENMCKIHSHHHLSCKCAIDQEIGDRDDMDTRPVVHNCYSFRTIPQRMIKLGHT